MATYSSAEDLSVVELDFYYKLTGMLTLGMKRAASRSDMAWNPGMLRANSSYTENRALETPPTFSRIGSGIRSA